MQRHFSLRDYIFLLGMKLRSRLCSSYAKKSSLLKKLWGGRSCMKTVQNIALQQPLRELLFIQNQLCQQSKYFGPLLQRKLGTDTFPFVLMATEGERLTIDGVCFFRIEAVEDSRILIRLLQGYSATGEVTTVFYETTYLVKTEQIVAVPLQMIAAIQLSDLPLQDQFFIESKW